MYGVHIPSGSCDNSILAGKSAGALGKDGAHDSKGTEDSVGVK